MKKSLTLLLNLVFILSLTSCSFSTGTKADLMTGLQSSWNGLSVESIYFVDEQDQSISNKQIKWNSECSFVFEGIENFMITDGNAFPGLNMKVTDLSGNEVIDFGDMMESYAEGLPPTDASVLRATLTVGDPMKVGEIYTLSARVYDKNGEGEIVSKIEVKVVE
jgi:hypothetical protein